jgi:predicted GIY-YIG superfamily endonuclease
MRDKADTVLYVGKARNLRQRLASYRVANPARMPRRHLRLLRAVTRIELQQCADEAAALAREAELLRELRPRFNRAGTWRGPDRFLGWRIDGSQLELAVREAAEPGWQWRGPMGTGAMFLCASLARLLWCAIYPERGLQGMPAGWFRGRFQEDVRITLPAPERETALLGARLDAVLVGQADEFAAWIRDRARGRNHPFECAARDADLETITEFASRSPVR